MILLIFVIEGIFSLGVVLGFLLGKEMAEASADADTPATHQNQK